ncbi:MAG: methionyl-tRNA formyltransferase [Spirochaetaceae bacterium]|jgi:methionyl-tRNA formyltransferase|nr:methionyl-tRNA formyltransferase [Spirochaetaceae bacterium]
MGEVPQTANAEGPDKNLLRLLFAGSPAIALDSLRMTAEGALAKHWVLAGILTNSDKRRGRGKGAEPTDVGRAAAELAEAFAGQGIPAPVILKPEFLRAEAREAVAALRPDLLVCFAYGRIFGPKFLGLFPLGGINLHPSLLPKYRGASPIQEAILRRDSVTGISLQRVAPEMDCGHILAQRTIPLSGRETAGSLGETAGREGAAVLGQFLESLCRTGTAGGASFQIPGGIPQEGEPSYCTRIEKDFGIIHWNRSAPEIDAVIRACNPWPLARTCQGGKIVHILGAVPWEGPEPENAPREPGRVLGIDKKSGILVQTGGGILAVTHLQYQTKKALSWQAFLNGAKDFIGSRLQGEE